MDEKEKLQQAAINVFGVANIGCTMENVTFQTLVQDAGPAKVAENNVAEEVKGAGRRGRPQKAGKKTQKSFIYQAHDNMDTNLRLQSLYCGLLQLQWIAADTKQKSFMSIFSGEDTACRVTWTGDINTLAELFKELVTRKGYVKLPEGESIWVMVNARFWEKEGNKEFGNDRLRSTSAPTGSKDAIDLLVKVMNPDMPLESLREAMHAQH